MIIDYTHGGFLDPDCYVYDLEGNLKSIIKDGIVEELKGTNFDAQTTDKMLPGNAASLNHWRKTEYKSPGPNLRYDWPGLMPDIIKLHFDEKRTLKEIAKKLEVSYGALSFQLNRGNYGELYRKRRVIEDEKKKRSGKENKHCNGN